MSRKSPWWLKLLPVLAVLYVISPVDLVPDFAPIIGWLDDVGILGVVTGLVIRSLKRHLQEPPEGE